MFIDMNLQENIRRIKEMMNLNEKLGDIKGTPLYHKTDSYRGLDIMKDDALYGFEPSRYYDIDKKLASTKTKSAISLTRDKDFYSNWIGFGLGDSKVMDLDMTFVLDRAKLQTKYEVEPFNYFALDPHEWGRKTKGGEFEERVLTNEISPLHKYLIDVIYTGDEPEIQQEVDEYKNMYLNNI
jgi:hypothetical protein